jgi:flagellar biosynthetic protein FliR
VSIILDPAWLVTLLLLATRLAGLFLLSPALGFNRLPPQARVAVVLLLALCLSQSISTEAGVVADSITKLVLALIGEFLIGAMIGFGVHAAFAALSFAGQFLDFQIGLNAAAAFDLNAQAQSPLLSTFFGLFGGLIFLLLDAHHDMLRGLAYSLTILPLNHFSLPDDAGPFVTAFGLVFTYGLVLAGPVVLGLMLLDIAIAVIARTMPQISIYFVTLPLKIFVGVLLLALTMSQFTPVLERLFAAAFGYWLPASTR